MGFVTQLQIGQCPSERSSERTNALAGTAPGSSATRKQTAKSQIENPEPEPTPEERAANLAAFRQETAKIGGPLGRNGDAKHEAEMALAAEPVPEPERSPEERALLEAANRELERKRSQRATGNVSERTAGEVSRMKSANPPGEET